MNLFRKIVATALLLGVTGQQIGFADRILDPTLTIGKPTAVDKKVEFDVGTANKPAIRANATTGVLEFANDGIGFRSIGSGSGGVKSFISQDFETDISGVSGYADAAATTPVDGTGSTATTLTLSRTAVGGEVLDGTGSLKVIKSAANGQGQGFSIDFVMDLAYRSKAQGMQFQFNTNSANYVAGDIVACLYDKDIAALIPISGADVGLCKAVPKSANGIFQATWNASTSDDYRMIFHVSTTNASTYTLFFDKPIATPQQLTDGVPVTDWKAVAYDSGNFLSNAGSWVVDLADQTTFQYKRSGDEMVIFIGLNSINASGSVSELRIKIPENKTIGSAYRAQGRYNDGGTVVDVVLAGTATNNYVRIVKLAGGNFSTTANSSDFNVQFSIPIAEWVGSANIVNGPNIEYACNTSTADTTDTTSFSNDPDGCLVPQVALSTDRSKQIRFSTAKQLGDKYTIEYRVSNGYWQTLDTLEYQTGLSQLTLQASTYYGMGVERATTGIPATDLNVIFARYAYPNSGTFGTAGASWSAGALVGVRYRVRKESGVAPTAYAAVTSTSPGFFPSATSGLENGIATILGLKPYYHGTSYNGGNAPTITLSGVSLTGTVYGVFIPYQMQDGSWRLRFNMRISPSNGTAISGNTFNVLVNGVTYKNQNDAVTYATSTNTNQIVSTFTNVSANIFTVRFSTSSNYNSTDYYFAGDVGLDSKPTWAY